ncbi:STN and carboxypeptidase regulatory-like domain-containing protein [Sediminitomix flava]|uniref:Carboxypeptidase-like protein n=1 Tax=Sediminitomix flava TaxID=379075 RepID=A0A315ZJR4_SEDFL|nr:STN and carboxypeptidase regulatory-like domain-containing protein [Sediminitomix flava]PWJ44924.1 hypothetical protein BC781_1011313 [Sediminitomix flava]
MNFKFKIHKRHLGLWSFIFLSLLCLSSEIIGSGSPLKRKVSVELEDASLKEALDALAEQANFDYAFNAKLLAGIYNISISAKNEEVEAVLDELLTKYDLQYRWLGSQLVIYQKKKEKKIVTVSKLYGQVWDASSQQAISGVAIQDQRLGLIGTTKDNGGFSIELPTPNFNLNLSFSHPKYQNKRLKVKLRGDRELQVRMEVDQVALEKEKALLDSLQALQEEQQFLDSLEQALAWTNDTSAVGEISPIVDPVNAFDFSNVSDRTMVKLFLPSNAKEEIDKKYQLQERGAQVSVMPVLGSNFLNGHRSINKFSLNLVSGYSAATDGFELGTVLNINRFGMNGVQVSGLMNVVGGSTSGVQFATLMNYSKLYTQGLQFSFMMNFNRMQVEGMQIAGFSNNIKGEIRGVQLAGINNGSRGGKGVQLAGLWNKTKDDFIGWQFTTISNKAKKDFYGIQTSAFHNEIEGNLYGLQTNLLINSVSDTLKGVQVAPFNIVGNTSKGFQVGGLNRTTTLRGVQLGLVNVADTVESGFSLGVVNFIRNGYTALEAGISSDAIVNLKYKGGTNQLYSILSVGMIDEGIRYGYGLGTAWDLASWMGINFDANAFYDQIDTDILPYTGWTAALEADLYMKLTDHFEIYFGGSFNTHFKGDNYLPTEVALPYKFSHETSRFGQWWSYQGGVRFRF